MGLSVEQIQDYLEKPLNKESLDKAIRHEGRLRFHTEKSMDTKFSPALTSFLSFVDDLIPKDKVKIFRSLLKYPIQTTSLTDNIYRELEKIFDSRNASFTYQFADKELGADWERYRQNVLKEPWIWKEKGWEQMKNHINSVLVCDLPEKQVGQYPEPYFYWLDITAVKSYKSKGDKLDWIIFDQPEDKIAVFDDTFIRVFEVKDNKILRLVSENEHMLGYCPARFFWTSSISCDMPDVKQAPISKELSNLDWFLFFATSKRHLDLYAPYPIYAAYESDCDYESESDYCDGGYLRDKNNHYIRTSENALTECPKCSKSHLAGAGSFVTQRVPKEGDVDLKTPVQIITVDGKSLEYNVAEVARLKQEITESVIGRGGVVSDKEAMNVTQLEAQFENRTTVLNSLKSNFEKIQYFIDSTICNLRYGKKFKDCNINYGTQFYIYTVENLQAKYKAAKENGLSEAELDALDNLIIQTEYRNNPLMLQRMTVLKSLEPYRNYTRQEVLDMDVKGLLDPLLVRIKINFSRYIDRFERENMNVVEFGGFLSYDKKISKINETIKQYGNEDSKGKAVESKDSFPTETV